MWNWLTARHLVVGMVAMLAAGCHQHSAAPSVHHDTRPAVAGTKSYSNSKFGIHFDYPAEWAEQKSDDFALLLVPAGSKAEAASFSLDVPELPAHIPGLIPMGSVKEGFLKDLKKHVGAIETKDLPDPSIPDANTRLVRSTWQANGKTMTQTALLMTHHDRVYILRGTADGEHEKQMEAGMDGIIKSITW